MDAEPPIEGAEKMSRPPSKIVRVLRTVLWALLFAFVFGFVIGTVLRRQFERPIRYIGERSGPDSIPSTAPYDIADALPRVLMPGDHEEQV